TEVCGFLMRGARVRVICRCMPSRPRPRPIRLLLACAVLAVGLVHGRTAHAAPLSQPWLPPGTDSLTVWAAEARARFTSNTGDSVGGRNYRPYDLVGSMGRRLLASLGRQGMTQAHAVET